MTPLHWTDGGLIDLDRLAPAVHRAGAALVIDATQAVGAVPVDVARWRPDFLAFPTYKWALGPYGVASSTPRPTGRTARRSRTIWETDPRPWVRAGTIVAS